MFKTIAKSPSRRPAGAAGPQKAERLLLLLVTGGILLALGIAVLLLRFQRLSELPPGLAFDEGVHGELALQVLQGEHAVFFPEDYGRQAWAPYVLGTVHLPYRAHAAGDALALSIGQCSHSICRLLVGTNSLWER